jgi:hypothetical protein
MLGLGLPSRSTTRISPPPLYNYSVHLTPQAQMQSLDSFETADSHGQILEDLLLKPGLLDQLGPSTFSGATSMSTTLVSERAASPHQLGKAMFVDRSLPGHLRGRAWLLWHNFPIQKVHKHVWGP